MTDIYSKCVDCGKRFGIYELVKAVVNGWDVQWQCLRLCTEQRVQDARDAAQQLSKQ